MKNQILFSIVLLIASFVLNSCSNTPQTPSVETDNPLSYFDPIEKGVQNGGVKMVSIETPKGTFKVWTKRIGNNPTKKILLLNGGPGLTHEYFECFENFLPSSLPRE